MKKMSRATVVYVAYVFVLLGFVSLGLFVAALAFGSSLAVVAGVILAGSFTAAVVAFRIGSRRAGSVWTDPAGDEQVDRYLAAYRANVEPPADESAEAGTGHARAA